MRQSLLYISWAGVFFLLLVQTSLAQETKSKYKTKDAIYLTHQNHYIIGSIVENHPDSLVVIQLKNGRLLHIGSNRIAEIKKVQVNRRGRVIRPKKPKPKREYLSKFREQGWYRYLGGALNRGYVAHWNEDAVYGFDLNVSGGYQFNRLLGVGMGVGSHYYYGRGQGVFPIFTEVRGYFSPKAISSYYNVGLGWGFTGRDQSKDIQQAQGGIFFHPALGIRLGGSDMVNFIFDLGVKIQRINYNTTDWGAPRVPGEESPLHVNRVRYTRLTLRAGMIF